MNRNQFIKLSTITGIGMASIPFWAFKKKERGLSYDELIGKGNPELFGNGFKLREEAHDAFLLLKKEAEKSGISINIVSSYRSFSHQNTIWERKYKSYTSQGLSAVEIIQKIIEYSTIPGTSRHHWGTDMDIVDANAKQPSNLLNPENFEPNASFGKLKQWMDANSKNYGFYLVYTDETNRKGFKYEPWHYSYRPLSCKYLSEYRLLNLGEILQTERLMGSDHFSETFVHTYFNENILDINPELL
ncbi:MAG: M15 family metallopeptidase [Aquaticitalea sp.]